jgi:hypothetical protein
MTKAGTQSFSDDLERWIRGREPKTLLSLISRFREKSFAVVTLILMLIPALPLPTGGVTHIFEIVVALIAIEQMLGFKGIWLPEKLGRKVQLERVMKGTVVTALLKRVRWLENHSSPRLKSLFAWPLVNRFIGLLVLGLTVAAFLAPPFSGLDTLPALGVVMISLGVILEDAVLLLGGAIVGICGVILSLTVGSAIVKGVHHLFNR